MKGAEGINQRMFTLDPGTATKIWGLTLGGKGEGMGGGEKREKKMGQL